MPSQRLAHDRQLLLHVGFGIAHFPGFHDNAVVPHFGGVVFPQILQNIFRRVLRSLAHPNNRSEKDQKQQGHPNIDGTPQTLLFVAHKNVAEGHKAQDAPNNQYQIGFGSHFGYNADKGQEEIGEEENRADKAHQPRYPDAFIVLRHGFLPSDVGSVGVGNTGADGIDIHNPANGRSSQKGNGQGYEGYKQNGVDGNAPGIYPSEPPGEQFVGAYRPNKAAAGDVVPQEAGNHAAHHRYGQNKNSAVAPSGLHGVKSGKGGKPRQFIQIPDVGRPVAISGGKQRHRQPSERHISDNRRHNRRHHNGEGFFYGEFELCR